MPAPMTSAPDRIVDVLESHYRLDPIEIIWLPVGQGTHNYRVRCTDRNVFVKHYPPDTDLDSERAGISMSAMAGEAGVPVATIQPNVHGERITERAGVAVSVWDWVDASVIETGFTRGQLTAMGTVLGTIHRAFAGYQGPVETGETDVWMAFDPHSTLATVDRLLHRIAELPAADRNPFDDTAEHTLRERRDMLPGIPGLLADLPRLSSQVLHGDYSAVNLLFSGNELAAVLDFRPPSPFLVSFELGRIAFDPRTVVHDPTWLTSAATLVGAYLAANPAAHRTDIVSSGRIALVQLLRSLYGVKQHYLKPGLLQDDLDAFWVLRHRTAATLLENLDEIETALAETWAANRRSPRTRPAR
jgi:hypothetical protein